MKHLALLFTTILILTLVSCRKENSQSATVVKDCTGTYLRMNNNDYQVCNLNMTEKFKSEQRVVVSFNSVKECAALKDQIVCYMYHENEGFVEVNSIEKE